MPLSGSVSFLVPFPRIVGAGRFFHHLIVSSRIPSASFHLVSFPVSDDNGARGVSFLCLVFCLMPCHLISSDEGQARQRDGVRFSVLSHPCPCVSVLSRCHPRLARRFGLSCRRASRPVPSGRLMRLIKQARRRGGTSPGSRLVVMPHYPCGGRAILGSRSVLRGVVIVSSHIIPGKQARRQEETR